MVVVNGEGERGPGQHPGPYMSEMFKFLSRKGNSIKMVCLLCAPAYKEVSAYVSSPSNLRKHIQVSIKLQVLHYIVNGRYDNRLANN